MRKTLRIGALLALGLSSVAGCDGAPAPAPGEETRPPVGQKQDALALYDGVGRFLEARGVDLGVLPVTAQTSCMDFASPPIDRKAQSAAYVYCDMRGVMIADHAGADTLKTVKLMDLFMTAAPEVIGAMRAGRGLCAGQELLQGADALSCDAAAASCLQGFPATPDQLTLCARTIRHAVSTAADPALGTAGASALENGLRIAAASLMSAAHLGD